MLFILNIIQIILSVLLVTAILLQQRGGGLTSVFGGDIMSGYRTRRGVEKIVFMATVILAALYLTAAFLNILLR